MAFTVTGKNKAPRLSNPHAEFYGTLTGDTDYDGGTDVGYLVTPAMCGMHKIEWAMVGNSHGYQAEVDYDSLDADAGFRVRIWKGASEASDSEDGIENKVFPLYVRGS